VLFIGNDWAEAHHDIELVDEDGRRLARRRLPEGVDGLAALHALVADHRAEDDEADQVVVGIETDRGPWVQALIAVGYTVAVARRMRVKTGLADTDGALVPVPGGSEEPPLWELRAHLTELAQDAAIRSSGS
jgi:hypothetical protein